tara:strand:- start:850 stop:1020 length:171 start_codon:yes stop_codon:yes gene_type:complete
MMTDEFMGSKLNEKINHQSLELNLPRINGPIVYNFDHVFLPESRQADIFNEIKPFI